MTKMIFVNLPVNDLAASTRFYEAIGCVKNPQFSDEKASAMVWSDAIYFMLLSKPFYSTFISRPIADAKAASGALYALTLDSREAVDEIVAKAVAGGGSGDIREAQDMEGFMYGRTFQDPDGNVFEPTWMNPAATGG